METRKHIAAEKLENGTHNCAQAIVSYLCRFFRNTTGQSMMEFRRKQR